MGFMPSDYCKAAWIAITWLNRYPNLSERGDDKRVYAKHLKTKPALRYVRHLQKAWCQNLLPGVDQQMKWFTDF